MHQLRKLCLPFVSAVVLIDASDDTTESTSALLRKLRFWWCKCVRRSVLWFGEKKWIHNNRILGLFVKGARLFKTDYCCLQKLCKRHVPPAWSGLFHSSSVWMLFFCLTLEKLDKQFFFVCKLNMWVSCPLVRIRMDLRWVKGWL